MKKCDLVFLHHDQPMVPVKISILDKIDPEKANQV